jgi:hypothetical protein
MLRKFDSGVKVIQTKTHSDEEASHSSLCHAAILNAY